MKKSKIIKELIKRRDEVIKRAKSAYPDFLINARFNDYKMWLLEPFLKKEYISYNQLTEKLERKIKDVIYKEIDKVDKEKRPNKRD